MSVRGSCLCGQLKYEIEQISDDIDHCHCKFCQKATGAAFGSYTNVDPKDFHWLAGEDTAAHYQSSPHSGRLFCPSCGSLIASTIEGGKALAVTLGTLDEQPVANSGHHIFVRSKVPWYEITDGLPQHDAYPPEFAHLLPTDNPGPG